MLFLFLLLNIFNIRVFVLDTNQTFLILRFYSDILHFFYDSLSSEPTRNVVGPCWEESPRGNKGGCGWSKMLVKLMIRDRVKIVKCL